MAKYRKKPVIVEAIQWFSNGQAPSGANAIENGDHCVIPTLEGNHKCNPGDWIIKGVKGEFYPCKPDIFGQTYELVD